MRAGSFVSMPPVIVTTSTFVLPPSVRQHTNESNSPLDKDDDDSIGEDGFLKRKQRRRSKNDIEGRDHRCQFCEKTYLSYPALYTHMKTKHSKGPDGQPLLTFNSGRGRGRPKKNASIGGYKAAVEPTSDDYLKTVDKFGGPVQPTDSFADIYTEIFVKRGAMNKNMMGLQHENPIEFGDDTQLQDRDNECSEGDDKIPKSFENSVDPDDD